MTALPTTGGGGTNPIMTNAQTQTEPPPSITTSPVAAPSDTMRYNQNRQSYRPPHQLKSPDATHAGSAALLAAQHTKSPEGWTYDGNANAGAAASLARAHSKPIEAWKPDKLSSAGAAASLAHRASVSERPTSRDASNSAAAALRAPHPNETHEPAPLAVSSAGASLTNSAAHAMRAASMAHKPSLSKSPEQVKTSPTHALKAASTADRDSAPQKSHSPTYYRTPEESARIQKLAQELARRDMEKANATATGGVSRSDLTRVATLSMQRKTAADLAEQGKEAARKRQIEEEAFAEYNNQHDLEDAARRIVAERIARVCLTGEEGDEVLAGKAAGESIHRGDKRVKDWEEVLKTLDNEDKSDRERGTGWLRHSMRLSDPLHHQDPSLIMAAAQRNVKSQMDAQDKSIAQEHLILGKPTGETAARRDAYTRDLEQKGNVELDRAQKQRASTYDIGGMIMTHEQVEAIAQKHVNEVLAEINEKVEREKERIQAEREEREARLREKEAERQAAREKAAEEKAEKDKLKAEQREQKAEEKRLKDEAKAAERKKKEDAKAAQKELKNVTKEQLAVGEGIIQYDAQKDKEGQLAQRREEIAKEKALNEVTSDQTHAVDGVLQYDAEKDNEALLKGVPAKVQSDKMVKEEFLDQAHAVEGVQQHDSEKDREDFIKGIQERTQAQKALSEASKDQAHAVEGVIQHDNEQDQAAFRQKVAEKVEANKMLDTARQEQAQAAEVTLHPETALDDDPTKGGKIKSWFKEKIGRRLSRAHEHEPSSTSSREITKSPPPKTSTSTNTSPTKSSKEEEDLYGEQPPPPMASNWRSIETSSPPATGTSNPREDSLRNVALARPDSPVFAGPKVSTSIPSARPPKDKEPHEINDLSAYKVGNYEDPEYTSGEEEFNDAAEELDEPTGVDEKMGVPESEMERKISGERASRFKEEF